MCIGLIGGMDRLERHYIKEADRIGVHLKVFSQWEKNLSRKINSLDALVVFTNKVSHMARKEAMDVSKCRKIPILMFHSCGLSTFRNCLELIRNRKKGE